MSDLPSILKKIQVEETDFRSPVSESTMQKIGGVINFIQDHYLVYPGMIIDYAGTIATVPAGWLVCDGSAVSRTTYSLLYTAIGTDWGEGDGFTTFNLPDLRGYFTRMQDLGAGRDPGAGSRTNLYPGGAIGDNVGSYQDQSYQSHSHFVATVGGGSVQSVAQGVVTSQNSTGITTSSSGGNETRPKNAYVLKLIKY